MSLWKDANNQVHDDDEGRALSLPNWPQGMTQITQAEADALLAPPPPTQTQLFAQAEAAVQAVLDNQAKAWQYESILSAASYVASTVTQFANEGKALVAWRDQVWSACYAEMAAIQANQKPMPALADFIASLPPAPARPA